MNNDINEMNENKIKVYAKVDGEGNVKEVDSSIFLTDTTGWIEIDEGFGDRYALAQSNYFETPLLDEYYGNPLYRYVDGEIVTNPPYEPDPAVILEQQKQTAIAQTKSWVAAELEKPMKWTDGKLYTVTLEKQNLLSAQLGMYMMNAQSEVEFPLTWNASGEPCEEWTFEKLLALSNAIAAHVSPIVAKQQHAEITIRQAVNYEQIEAVLQDFV